MKISEKNLLSLSLTVGLFFQNTWLADLSLAAPTVQDLPPTQATESVAASAELPAQLEQDIKESIATVYGAGQVEPMYHQVLAHIHAARAQRPQALLEQDLTRQPDWYQNEIIYMLYADRYGLRDGKKTTSFHDIIGTLDYLKQLGVTTLYILPFMDSPMGDAGFDVRDFKSVREDLGGLSEFQNFAQEAHKRGFKLKSDLILNHVSDQSAWFQEALAGNPEKMNYFIHTDRKPVYRKYNDPQKGWTVDYHEDNGTISSRSLVFPDMSDTQYREVTIQGKPYYFYHTFYPFQMDINWQNPQVLYEVLDIITFWANQGIDIFRLDAVPYLVKPKGTNGENQPETLAVIKLLSSYLQATAPSSVLQAEAGQKMQELLPYFGDERQYTLDILNQPKPMHRTDRVQIAYNFPYMSAIWASLITEDKSHFWHIADETPPMPSGAAWATFLRVHDELTLQMVDPDTRKIVADNLEPKGAEFRKGWGVSGRMANFLDKDPVRIKQAFAIMMSLPGIPIIYYGDEIGELNHADFAHEYAALREATQKRNNPNLDIISFYDSRDVNRGPVSRDKLHDAMTQPHTYSGAIFQSVRDLISARKANPALVHGSLQEIQSNRPELLAYLRGTDSEHVVVVNNLSHQAETVTLPLPDSVVKKLSNQGDLVNLQDQSRVAYQKTGNSVTLAVQPYDSLWLKLS